MYRFAMEEFINYISIQSNIYRIVIIYKIKSINNWLP